jgi:hypothetical protein
MHKSLLSLVFAIACAAQTNPRQPAASLPSSGKPSQNAPVESQASAGVLPGDGLQPVTSFGGTALALPLFSTPFTLVDSVINQSASGTVGIGGAPSVTAKLAVNGTVSAAGDITAVGKVAAGSLAASGNITATGNVTANTVSAVGGLSTNGNVAAGGNVSASQYKIGQSTVLTASEGAHITSVGMAAGAGSFDNAMFGTHAGLSNSGSANSILGSFANSQGTGNSNAYFGTQAAMLTGGNENTFLGRNAGQNVLTSNANTLIGANAAAAENIHNATAIGYRAFVKVSDSLVLGAVPGSNGGSAVKVGIGTAAPSSKLEVADGDIFVSTPGRGVVLRVGNTGFCAVIVINSSGQLGTTPTPCPDGTVGF